ncbi:MAG: alpha/beta fold hydrolase [Gammaproteobacteria bacterium]
MQMPRRLFAAVLVSLVSGLSGCAGYIAGQLVDAPRDRGLIEMPVNEHGQTPMDLLAERELALSMDDGIELRASVIDPAQREFLNTWFAPGDEPGDAGKGLLRLTLRYIEDGVVLGSSVTQFRPAPADGSPIHGTAVLLHGFSMDRLQMVSWAVYLASHGWRTVLVDLRGHGESGGDERAWGPGDGRDLQALANALYERELVVGPLVAFGASYGGAAALHWASVDRRLDAVVTLAAYANAGEVIQTGADVVVPFGRMIPDRTLARGIERAGERIGNDLMNGISPESVANDILAPVMIIHGADDRVVPVAHAQRLHDAMDGSTLWIHDDLRHLDITIRQDLVGQQILDWLDQTIRITPDITSTACPAMRTRLPSRVHHRSPPRLDT